MINYKEMWFGLKIALEEKPRSIFDPTSSYYHKLILEIMKKMEDHQACKSLEEAGY